MVTSCKVYKMGIRILLTGLIAAGISCKSKTTEQTKGKQDFTTPLGKVYTLSTPSEKAMQQYEDAKAAYENEPENADLLIWYGRRTAYLGQFEDAIAIYSKGIERFPEDARMYRHRGHRYISIREFDKAIADLEKAAEIIRGTDDEIEPDGMPNALNIPVSTLHGNIWYHLGLAYYLIRDYPNAYRAYLNCRQSGTNHDNLVSSTHWLYMIQRRLGNPKTADSLLAPITPDLTVIENSSYHNLCLFYKGLMEEKDLVPEGDPTAASDAIAYGLANWYLVSQDNVDNKKGVAWLKDIVEGENWSSFGYIAAESDLILTLRKRPDSNSE